MTLSIRGRATDALVAAVSFGLTLGVLAHGTDKALDPASGTLAALSSFPLLARRRSPLAVFAVTTAASATLNALGYPLGPPFGPTAALFFVAADERTRDRLRLSAAVVLGLFAAHVGAAAIGHHGFPASPILFGIVVWGGAFLVGDQVRQRRRRLADAVEHARRAERDLERERRLAAAEERTRIARDLHDSAAHSINVILVQAGAARLLQERDPSAARQALSTIEDVARETIGEIDQLVRSLRDGGVSPVEPTGLAALGTLVERHRAAGLEVAVHTHGVPRLLPPAVDQAAYRILQESLTNAARHGDGGAELGLAYGDRDLELTVSNPAAAAGPLDGGHGVLGMRERAALLHGSLHVESSGGRFTVRARLPYAGGT